MNDQELQEIERRAKLALAASQAVGRPAFQSVYDCLKLLAELRKLRPHVED